MKPIEIRAARIEDRDQFCAWAISTPGNGLDMDIFGYRNTQVRVACIDGKPVVYMPVQRPIVLESIAASPQANSHDVVRALKAIQDELVGVATQEGGGELIFAASEPTIPRLLSRHSEQGWEELPYKFYRRKVKV